MLINLIITGKITTTRNGVPVIDDNPPKLSDIITKATLNQGETVVATGKIKEYEICFDDLTSTLNFVDIKMNNAAYEQTKRNSICNIDQMKKYYNYCAELQFMIGNFDLNKHYGQPYRNFFTA